LNFSRVKGSKKMEHGKRPDTNTGNGSSGKKPILASENELDPTEEGLKPSPASTEIERGSTKPVSIAEALSLLQTLCSDLQSLGCKTAILAIEGRLYVRVIAPASIGKATFADGHIRFNGVPVSDL